MLKGKEEVLEAKRQQSITTPSKKPAVAKKMPASSRTKSTATAMDTPAATTKKTTAASPKSDEVIILSDDCDDEDDDGLISRPTSKKQSTTVDVTSKTSTQRMNKTNLFEMFEARANAINSAEESDKKERVADGSPDPINQWNFKKKSPADKPKNIITGSATAKKQSDAPSTPQSTQAPRRRVEAASLSGPGTKVDSGNNVDAQVDTTAKFKEPRKRKAPAGLPTPPATLKKAKLMTQSDYESDDEPTTPTPNPKSFKYSIPHDVLLANRIIDLVEDEPEEDKLPEVIIHVGGKDENEHEEFHFDKADVMRYPSISKHLKETPSPPAVITSPELESITPDDFRLVAEYIRTHDYNPFLVEGKRPHLQRIQSVYQRSEFVKASATLWGAAKSLKLEGLQQLIRRKMAVISPLEDKPLLILTRMVFFYEEEAETEVDDAMRTWLKEVITDRYYGLMEEESSLLVRALKGSFELAGYVHRRLAEDNEAGLTDFRADDD